eukprot:scaffold2657_cov368-Pavlova_lutheri.AAC.8
MVWKCTFHKEPTSRRERAQRRTDEERARCSPLPFLFPATNLQDAALVELSDIVCNQPSHQLLSSLALHPKTCKVDRLQEETPMRALSLHPLRKL